MSVRLNEWNQRECRGCSDLLPIFQEQRRHRQQQGTNSFTSETRILHAHFQELDRCALHAGCIACQVFRRALLLQTLTTEDLDALVVCKPGGPINVRRQRRDNVSWLEVFSENAGVRFTAVVLLSTANENRRYPTLQYGRPLDRQRLSRLESWIANCHETHLCANFKFSLSNPTWLIRILQGEMIQLISGIAAKEKGETLRYVALSYCWGDEQSVNASCPGGWDRVQRSATTSDNLDIRRQPFRLNELTETLQDAIAIVSNLGIEYIWIDSVCVPEGTWDEEAKKMHEVYGNAHFTLSSSGERKATDRIIVPQSVWRDESRGCRLHGPWMLNVDMPLNEVRSRAPVAARGWIMQEERLSPRILYWCAQRAYWSCNEAQRIEAKQPGGLFSQVDPRGASHLSHPQRFMQLCWDGDSDDLPGEWSDLVSAFARRYFSNDHVVENRFAAFSGLAVRYLRATSTTMLKNEYLAGLWRNTIAQNLLWKVNTGVHHHESLQPDVPSWTWLSLPLGSNMDMPTHVEPSREFRLLTVADVREEETDEEVVRRGAEVSTLQLCGRFRRLMMDEESIRVPWDGIEREAPLTGFDFSLNPSQPMFSRKTDGKILVYEAHQKEIVGQLDYLVPEDGLDGHNTGKMVVEDGDEKLLCCLEVGSQSMLLLQSDNVREDCFRRVGVANGYRKNFFDQGYSREIDLV